MLFSLKPLRSLGMDRIQWVTLLLVCCFVGVLLLQSQSAASYPTYLLAILMAFTTSQWRDVFRLSLMRWILVLVLWLCLSVFWSEPFVLREAFSIWSRAVLMLCFLVAVAECLQRGQLQTWLGWSLTFVGVLAVIAATVVFYLTEPEDGRLNGLGQLDTHVVAALVYGVVLLFIVRMFCLSDSAAFRGLALALSGIIIFAIVMTDSRNAWVSVAFGVLVYLFAFYCSDRKQFVAALASLVLIGVVGLISIASHETYGQLLLPRGDSFRLSIWSDTLEQIINNSLFTGRGILTNDDVVAGDVVFAHPHSMYLAVLHQGGLVALLLFLIVVSKVLKLALSFYEHSDAKLALGLLGIALPSYLLDGHELVDKVSDTWFLFWLPLGIVLGLSWKSALSDRSRLP